MTSRTSLVFEVPGKAAPQGSKRHVGGGRLIESSSEVGPWRERVALAASAAMQAHRFSIVDGPVSVSIRFILPRPLSTRRNTSPPATRRPDLDKLVRAVLDAITDVVVTDDSRVVRLDAAKWIADEGQSPGATIIVHFLTDDRGTRSWPE